MLKKIIKKFCWHKWGKWEGGSHSHFEYKQCLKCGKTKSREKCYGWG